jgi:hypothetical protein
MSLTETGSRDGKFPKPPAYLLNFNGTVSDSIEFEYQNPAGVQAPIRMPFISQTVAICNLALQ